MTLTYPVDAPGYVEFPGTSGNYLWVPYHSSFNPGGTPTQMTVVMKIAPVKWGDDGESRDILSDYVGGGGGGGFQLRQQYGKLLCFVNNGTTPSGGAYYTECNVFDASFKNNEAKWLSLVITGGTARWWRSDDGVTWTAFSGTQPINNIAAITGALIIGNEFKGKIYRLSLFNGANADGTPGGGTEVFRFDGSQDLAGVVPDATSFKPSVAPTNSVVTVERKPTAVGQGYATFPGTAGNYLTTPDAVALDITGALYLLVRARHVDSTPINVTVPFGKVGSYRVVSTPDGMIFSWSTDGVTYLSAMISNQSAIPSGKWVWYSFYFNPTSRVVKEWYSTEDLLIPPAAVSWTLMGSTTGTTTGIFNGSGPAQVGAGLTPPPSFEGDIGYAAIKSGGTGGTPLEGTEVFTLDASSFVGISPDAVSLTAATAQTVSVVRSAVPKGDGFITFPGTVGNYLLLPHKASLNLAGRSTITVCITPQTWRPYEDQTIVSKWATAGQRSYALMLDTAGRPMFLYSVDGSAYTTVRCGTPLPITAGFLWLRVITSTDATNRTVTFETSLDRITWTPLGVPLFGPPGAMFVSTSHLILGALYEGRLHAAMIYDRAAPLDMVVYLASEHIPVNPAAPMLPETVITGYLDAPVGSVSTPDSGPLPAACVWVMKLRPTNIMSSDHSFGGQWDAGTISWSLYMQNGNFFVGLSLDGTTQYANSYAGAINATTVPNGVDVYFAMRIENDFNGTQGRVTIFRSADGTNWTQVGLLTPTKWTVLHDSTGPIRGGVRRVGSPPFQGRMYSMEMRTGIDPNAGTLLWRFDANDYPGTGLSYVDPRGKTWTLTTANAIVPRTPTGDQWTVGRSPVPVDFGYLTFPGTVGNYLSVPNSAALQNVTKFVVEARLIPDDWSPRGRDRVIVSKTGDAPTLGWRFLLTTQGTLAFEYSTAGTAWNQYLESAPVGLGNKYAKRVAFSLDSTTGFANFWTSDDNLYWTRLGTDLPYSGLPFVTTAPLLIGAEYAGAISNVSFRNSSGSGGVPIQGTEVLLIDQACLDIDDDATSFVATTGQTVTIVRTPSAVDFGWVTLPGTDGNYLTVPAAGFPTITGSITFIMRLAADQWLGQRVLEDPEDPESDFHYEGPTQTIAGRWNTANYSYLLRLSPAGAFLFSWVSADGLTEYTVTTVPVPAPAAGEFRFLAVTVQMGATQTFRLYETHDLGDIWVPIGSPVVTTHPATALRSGTAPLLIGAQDVANNIFGGRLSYLSIHNGTGLGGTPGGVEVFRIDADSLRINEADLSFVEETGKTVTLQQSFTPVITGYVAFGGVVDEFCRVSVPALAPMTSDFTIMVRIDFTEVPLEEEEQVILSKWPSFSLRRLGNAIIFQATQNGADSVINLVLSDAWDDEDGWGWLAVTANYKTDAPNAGATVSFWTAPDVRNTYDTPLAPVSSDWVLQGDEIFFDDVTALFMDTANLNIGGESDGTMPLKGNISNVSIRSGIGANNRPGGTELFGWDIDSFFGITGDSDAFTAETGENVILEPVGAERTMVIVPSPPGPVTSIEASPPGPTTGILPAPTGPVTTFTRGVPGPVVVFTPSPTAGITEIVPPSIDSPWWPGTDTYPDDTSKWWPQPAFSVQRSIRGVITGGDFVRGSTSTKTQKTAIRYPTTLPGWTAAGVGKGILYSRPINYGTIEIEWNVPQQLIDANNWLEVALVRAAMGYPATVNDGQAIFRMSKSALYPNGYVYDDEDPPRLYTPQIWDPQDPETTGGIPGLPPGRWYYYALFFKIGKDWVRSAIHSCLLPRNHHHSDHLWYNLPPYYRWLDDQQRGGANDGDLKRWLSIFGFDLDHTREYVESVLHLYQTDFTPAALLRRLGDNFGVPYEPGIGDVCYRALVSRIGFLYRGRGTVGGLRSLIAAVSKCDCDVTMAGNVLLLPDDSQFVDGTGNWAGIHPDTVIPPHATIPVDPLPPGRIWLTHGTFGYSFGPSDGDGMMHVWTLPADATGEMLITCGDGIAYDMVPPRELFPLFTATPVDPGSLYGFAIQARAEVVGPKVTPHIFFFDRDGLPVDYIERLTAPPVVLTTTGWLEASIGGQAPPTAAYVVPALGITDRVAGSDPNRSPMVHFCGAQVYFIGTATEGAVAPFIRFLQLTGPPPQVGKKIGPARETPPFDPYIIGDDD